MQLQSIFVYVPRVTCHLPVRALYETEAQGPRRKSTANIFAKNTDEAPRRLALGGGLGDGLGGDLGGGLGVPGSHVP